MDNKLIIIDSNNRENISLYYSNKNYISFSIAKNIISDDIMNGDIFDLICVHRFNNIMYGVYKHCKIDHIYMQDGRYYGSLNYKMNYDIEKYKVIKIIRKHKLDKMKLS